MRIADVLRSKGSAVATITETTTGTGLLAELATHNIGAMVVVGEVELAVALGVATSAVLAFKQPLHGLVRRIDTPDLYAALKLLIASFIVLPLLPGGRSPAPDWKDRALCAETDPEAFFPEKGGSTREAKKVCSSCDVRAECLDFALGNDERFGIWGGLSERERRRIRRQRAQAARSIIAG